MKQTAKKKAIRYISVINRCHLKTALLCNGCKSNFERAIDIAIKETKKETKKELQEFYKQSLYDREFAVNESMKWIKELQYMLKKSNKRLLILEKTKRKKE